MDAAENHQLPRDAASAEPAHRPGPGKSPLPPLAATLEGARRGLVEVLPQLKRALDEHPEIWEQHGDLARHAEQAWIKRIATDDLLLGQSLRRRVERLRVELGGPSPTPLDALLVDRLIVSWLAAQHAELSEAVAASADAGRVAHLRLKRAESANRRFVAAAKALAQVRRLAAGIRIEIEHRGLAAPSAAAPAADAGAVSNGRDFGRIGQLLNAGAGTARVSGGTAEGTP